MSAPPPPGRAGRIEERDGGRSNAPGLTGTRRLAAAASSLATCSRYLPQHEISIEQYRKKSKQMQRIIRGTPSPF
jgi:hypothetical protein